MASSRFTNSDYINAYGSTKELIAALENTQKARKGVRTSGTSVEAAQKNLEIDILRILQSPLRKPQPHGYGTLPLDAVHPFRQLYKAVTKALSHQPPPDDGSGEGAEQGETEGKEDEQEEALKAEMTRRLAAFVRAIDPDHPYLRQSEEETNEGDDEGGTAEETKGGKKSEKKKAPEKKMSAKKAGKQRMSDSTQESEVDDDEEENDDNDEDGSGGAPKSSKKPAKSFKVPAKKTKVSAKKAGKQRSNVVQRTPGRLFISPPQLFECCTGQS